MVDNTNHSAQREADQIHSDLKIIIPSKSFLYSMPYVVLIIYNKEELEDEKSFNSRSKFAQLPNLLHVLGVPKSSA